jgi:hypothetical protein
MNTNERHTKNPEELEMNTIEMEIDNVDEVHAQVAMSIVEIIHILD